MMIVVATMTSVPLRPHEIDMLVSRASGSPMFLDERIYLRWAYWVAHGRRLRMPFIEGKALAVTTSDLMLFDGSRPDGHARGDRLLQLLPEQEPGCRGRWRTAYDQ